MLVYCLRNKVNGKVYVGKTIKGELEFRWREHARLACVKNSLCAIHRALRKHRPGNFEVFVLCPNAATVGHLDSLERYWIKRLHSNKRKFGYNMTTGGQGGVPTEEVKRKISKALMGHVGAFRGKHFSLQHRKRIGEAIKGRVPWNNGQGGLLNKEVRR